MNLFHVSIQQLWNTSLEQERLIDEISQKDISVNWIRRVAENYVATANPENWKGNGEKPKGFGICGNVSYNETGKYPFINMLTRLKFPLRAASLILQIAALNMEPKDFSLR